MNVPSLEISGLTLKYGDKTILKDVSFTLEHGLICAILGPNGSGKTTLLKTINGMKKPDSGSIKIFGKDVNSITAEEIGYVPQIKSIDRNFPARGYELVLSPLLKSWPAFTNRALKKKALEALSQVNAENLANREISELSGGELQRIYLARSLITNPKLLLLDEPATGVDLVCETKINEIINKARKDKQTTVLMVTHDISSAHYHSDCSLLLNKELIYFGESSGAFTEENIQKTFSHMGHHHDVRLSIRNV